jgi:hypothetical protein
MADVLTSSSYVFQNQFFSEQFAQLVSGALISSLRRGSGRRARTAVALTVWESDCGSLSNIVEYPNHLEHLLWAKHSFHALGTEIREG